MNFNGEYRDPLSGNYHLGKGYREYSPVLMRFVSPDSWSPFGAGGINPYAWCAGDPVNRVDPTGHHSVWGWMGIAAGVVLGALLTPVSGGSSLAAALSAISVATAVVSTGLAIAQQFVEKSDPKTAAALGWAALGVGIASELSSAALSRIAPWGGRTLGSLLKGPGHRSLESLVTEGKEASTLTQYYAWGGRNTQSGEGFGYVYFYDTYKKMPRLNIAGHGVIDQSNKVMIDTGHGITLNPRMLYEKTMQQKLIRPDVQNIRLIVCYSSRGKNAFIDEFSALTHLPVKGYENRVHTLIKEAPGQTLMEIFKPGIDFPDIEIYKGSGNWPIFGQPLDPYVPRISDPSVMTL